LFQELAPRVESAMAASHEEMVKQAQAVKKGFARPEYWVLAFGWSLGLCAGWVNVCAWETYGVYGSHVTGSTTWIGRGIASHILGDEGDASEKEMIGYHLVVWCCFLFGAFMCGVLIDKNQVHLGGKNSYGAALMGNSVLLIISYLVKDGHEFVGLGLLACASGLQNAMCTAHFGAVVRTTHVTGTTTDIGSNLGRMAMLKWRSAQRGTNMNVVESAEYVVDKKKLVVLGPMWFAYLVGAFLGTYVVEAIGQPDDASLRNVFPNRPQRGAEAILFPAAFTMISGLGYYLFRGRLVAAFETAAKEEIVQQIQEVTDHLGEESTAVKSFLGHANEEASGAGKDITSKFVALALELERIEKTIADTKGDIRNMQGGSIELRAA